MTAFVLACYLGTVSSGSIYFKSVTDCTFYADHLSGQVLETEDGSKRYDCMCKLVPQVNPKKSKGLLMTEDKKKIVNVDIGQNSFELSLRILGNEFVAIKIGSTNFSGKLIAGGILLLFFTLVLLEGFGLNEVLKQ